MQSTARKNELPLDKMSLTCEVSKKYPGETMQVPRDGAYVHGLFIEGARWVFFVEHYHCFKFFSFYVHSNFKKRYQRLAIKDFRKKCIRKKLPKTNNIPSVLFGILEYVCGSFYDKCKVIH